MEENHDLPMRWYLHGDERVRMLRYFVREQPDTALRLTSDYPPVPKIGAVIATYASIPYLDLNLHYLVNVNHIPVLIHDDCSPRRAELVALCQRYAPHVQLYITKKRMWHRARVGTLGDTNSFLVGLDWAKHNKCDILIKFSRRFVCLSNFADKLRNLALETEAFTFGSNCPHDDFPLRTECMAMNVKVWTHPWVFERLVAVIKQQYPIYAEFWFNDMAHTLAYYNASEKFHDYMKKQNRGPMFDGYVNWTDLMAKSRYNKSRNALWHVADKVEDYAREAEKIFPGRYTVKDFKDIEEF
ncbi:MAG: hypothetical protein AB7F40_05485 [Victivallaceae bacterium]|nr:hypothetical protein [Victivallaceae bacterium]